MGKGVVKLGDGNWAVKDGNLLAVKETNRRFKNTEFTVERGTRATYVGRDGLIKESDLQNTNLVLNGDYEKLGSNLITDGDFPTGTSAWSLQDGNTSLSIVSGEGKVTMVGGSTYIFQTFNTTSGKVYEGSFDFRAGDNVSTGQVQLRSGSDLGSSMSSFFTQGSRASDNSGRSVQVTNGTGTFMFTADNSTTTIRLINEKTTTPANAFWDNIIVKEVDPNDRWTLGSTWSISDGVANFTGSGSASSALVQNISLTNGNTYKIKFDVSNATGNASIWIGNSAGGVNYFGVSYVGRANGSYNLYFTMPSTQSTLAFYANQSGSNFSLDNVSVQEIKTATPRIDFTNNTDGHLLLEPARTNLIPYSEEFSDSSWTKTNVTIDPDSVTSPDGTVNADYLQENSSNSTHIIRKSFTLTADDYTLSIFAKQGSGSTRQIGLLFNELVTGALFNLNDGSVAALVGSPVVKSQEIGNGWYRFSITKTATASSINCRIYLGKDDVWTSTWTGDGSSGVFIYGAQLEEGSYPTSYIPTVGVAATRSAEVCKDSGTAADFNSTEGVLFGEVNFGQIDPAARYISVSNGSTNNRAIFGVEGGVSRVYYFFTNGGSGVVSLNSALSDISIFNKVAVKWKQNDFALWLNGVEVGTDTSGNTPSAGTFNSLLFTSGGTTQRFNGKVKQLEVYKTAFSDDQLIRLTGTLGTHFFESYASMAGALTYTIQ